MPPSEKRGGGRVQRGAGKTLFKESQLCEAIIHGIYGSLACLHYGAATAISDGSWMPCGKLESFGVAPEAWTAAPAWLASGPRGDRHGWCTIAFQSAELGMGSQTCACAASLQDFKFVVYRLVWHGGLVVGLHTIGRLLTGQQGFSP